MKCTATNKRTGNRCGANAIEGGNVCFNHGGGAPQVRKAAALRLAALINPAIGVIAKSLKSKTERIRLDAAKDVLDRNEMKSATKLYISGPEDGPVRVEFDVSNLTDEQLEIAKQFARTIPVDREGSPEGDSGV